MVPLTAHLCRSRPVASTPRRSLPTAAAIGAAVLLVGLVVMAAAARPAVAAAAPAAAALTTVSPDAVVVAPHDFTNGDDLITALSADGVDPAVIYLPRTSLAHVSPAAAARLRSLGFTVLRAHAAPPAGEAAETAAALAALDSLADRAAAAAAGDRAVIPAGLQSLGHDLKLPNAAGATGATQVPGLAAPAILGHLGMLPNATEPAAFAAGSVAVSIIFPQSTARRAGETPESWQTTDPPHGQPDPTLTDREGYIVGKVSTALAWWAALNPAAHLTFVIPAAGTRFAPQERSFNGATVNGKTIDEPIDVPSQDDQAWRHPIMKALGFGANTTADTPPPETKYDNAVRTANGTDWAFTLYCVDSLATTTGTFPDGAFAYTFDVFGPYTVTTYDNDGYGPESFDGVLAHEIGHVFGALDEYAPPTPGYPSTGDLYSGYLWVRNKNAVRGGTTNDACIMRGGNSGLAAYQGSTSLNDGGICPSTRGQIGWRATRNGIPDVVDTTPTVTLKPPTLDGSTATVAGVARENPWPPGHNAQGHAFINGISILVPHDVQYSVDGGAWHDVGTAGTAATESFGFTTPALGSGLDSLAPTRHIVEVRATTGTTAAGSVVAWSSPTPVTLALSSGAATIPLGGKVKLTVRASDTSDPNQSYPIAFLPGVAVGVPGGAHKTASTGAGGRAVVSFAPRFTATFRAAFQPIAPSPFEAAEPAFVGVAVRALLKARAGAPSAGRAIHVTGTFRPARSRVPLVLQRLTGGSWKAVARTHTTARSTFRLVYTASAGAVHLRVRFAGDAKNAAAVKALPALVVS
jgi:hypothetical protein